MSDTATYQSKPGHVIPAVKRRIVLMNRATGNSVRVSTEGMDSGASLSWMASLRPAMNAFAGTCVHQVKAARCRGKMSEKLEGY